MTASLTPPHPALSDGAWQLAHDKRVKVTFHRAVLPPNPDPNVDVPFDEFARARVIINDGHLVIEPITPRDDTTPNRTVYAPGVWLVVDTFDPEGTP